MKPNTRHLLRHPVWRFRHWLAMTVLRHLMRGVVWLHRKASPMRYGTSEDTIRVTLDGASREYVIRVTPEHIDRLNRDKVIHADMCDVWTMQRQGDDWHVPLTRDAS